MLTGYKILSIDAAAQTILIEWSDGQVLNHQIPVRRLVRHIPGDVRIMDRPGVEGVIDNIIKRERMG